jgi:hypothetical protein
VRSTFFASPKTRVKVPENVKVIFEIAKLQISFFIVEPYPSKKTFLPKSTRAALTKETKEQKRAGRPDEIEPKSPKMYPEFFFKINV